MALAEYELLELDGFMDEEEETDLLVTRPTLKRPKHRKRLACQAAKVAGRGVAGPKGARVALKVAKRAVREGEYEADFEYEGDFEAKFEAEGGDPELLAEMEALAELAAEAESEAEADEFLGALASLAGPLISSFLGEYEPEFEYEDEFEHEEEYEGDPFLGGLIKAATSIIPRVAPLVSRGVRMAGRFLRRPSTRRLIRRIPRTVARTAMDLRKMAQRGRPITPVSTAAVLGGNMARILSRRRRAQTMRRRWRRGSPGRTSRGRVLRRRGRRRLVRPRYCVL